MKSFRVALCQVRAYDLEDAETNLQGILAALDKAGAAGAQVVGLPECAYPAYYVRDANPYARPGVRPFEEVCGLFADKARQYGYWLAAGIAAPTADGRLTNSGIVFAPDGTRRGQYNKSFLWHFDTYWFERGREWPVWDTGFCRFGILICADARQPEIARSLALNGAEVILDLTAWVSWGRTAGDLSTPQCEYLVPVRAYENGVWVAAADKWGTEDGSIVYAGRSTVIDPAGNARVSAETTGDTVVVYDIEPVATQPVARRPALYARLVEPTDGLAASRLVQQPLTPARERGRIAVVPDGGAFDAGAVLQRYSQLRAQKADLVVFAGMDGPEGWQVALPMLESAVRAEGGAIVVGVRTTSCSATQSVALITPEATHEHQATHGRGIITGEMNCPVIETPIGNIGLLCGDEALVPEVPRRLALDGADILAWPIFGPNAMSERIARCRSDENKVYTAAAWPGGGLVVAPSGAPLIAVPADSCVAMTAAVSRIQSRMKEMAPHTDVIADRIPEAYGALVR
ncbi:MAG TPA: nitrilase-related carbon-nitrogen hydrolase [Tepidiformaceae bacterium]|nr:nitrilase-related carbon-nitrogen hydrolase [Tepidiformaceae bacterium]